MQGFVSSRHNMKRRLHQEGYGIIDRIVHVLPCPPELIDVAPLMIPEMFQMLPVSMLALAAKQLTVAAAVPVGTKL